MRPLRVLVSGVVLGQPMGGVRRHNAELLPRAAALLAAAGGRLSVLEGREPLAFALPPEVERLASRVPAGPPIVRVRAEGRALAEHLAAAAARGEPFDLVHTAHLPVPRLTRPFTLTLHDLRSLDGMHTPFSRRLVASHVVGQAVARAACTITVSETVRAALVARFEPQRIAVVPNAADHLLVLPRAPGPGAALLHVGHLEPRKNLDLVLRALALDPGLPDLCLVGAPKRDEDRRLRELAARLGVTGRVRFLGPCDDAELPRLYAGAAGVVLPSRLEGFGIGVLEAQRARVPLAIADAGALPEVAGPGVPRFAPDDPQACARAVRAALAQDEDELARAAERAARASWDDSARVLCAVWDEAAGA